MEKITKKINGFDCTVVLTDGMLSMISDLQSGGDNGTIKEQMKTLGDVIRHITFDYNTKEADKLIKMVAGITYIIDTIEAFTAPPES